MKIRKTRIRKETKANGTVWYTPEYKGVFFWYSLWCWESPDPKIWTMMKRWLDSKGGLSNSEALAKEAIDYYIARVNYHNACDIENKVIKEEYERYP